MSTLKLDKDAAGNLNAIIAHVSALATEKRDDATKVGAGDPAVNEAGAKLLFNLSRELIVAGEEAGLFPQGEAKPDKPQPKK